MKKKTAKEIKNIYIKFIESAPDKFHSGTEDIIFVYLYLYVKGKISRKELVDKMQELSVSGLAMAYLVEEIDRKKSTFNRYKLSDKYGL